MNNRELTQVLANWIAEAMSSQGKLPDQTNPAEWAASHFLTWWRSQIEDDLLSAESALQAVDQEMQRLGGWSNSELGEAMHELIHVREALIDLRAAASQIDA